MIFHWSLSDSKFPQVSRILPSILAVLNNVVVWMVSTRPLISKSSSPFDNPWVTVPRVPITIGIIATFTFHIFFQFPSEVEVLIFLFIFLQFCNVVSRDSKVLNSVSSFFFLDYYRIWSSHPPRVSPPVLVEWSPSVSKTPQFSKTLLRILVDFGSAVPWSVLPVCFLDYLGVLGRSNHEWYHCHFNVPWFL